METYTLTERFPPKQIAQGMGGGGAYFLEALSVLGYV